MSLWGPAVEAEIEYRQAELSKAWGGRRTSGSDRADRTEHRAEQRRTAQSRAGQSRAGQGKERSARSSRAEQIRKGIAGMRPEPPARRGLFA